MHANAEPVVPAGGGSSPPYDIVDCLGDFTGASANKTWAVAGVASASKDHTLLRKATVSRGNPAQWHSAYASSQGTNGH